MLCSCFSKLFINLKHFFCNFSPPQIPRVELTKWHATQRSPPLSNEQLWKKNNCYRLSTKFSTLQLYIKDRYINTYTQNTTHQLGMIEIAEQFWTMRTKRQKKNANNCATNEILPAMRGKQIYYNWRTIEKKN